MSDMCTKKIQDNYHMKYTNTTFLKKNVLLEMSSTKTIYTNSIYITHFL